MKILKVEVKGRVQGVWFRAWTLEQAEELGIDGWIRNKRDGSVEALLSGSIKNVDAMLERISQGPPAAKVSAVNIKELDIPPEAGFHQRPTI